MAEERASQLVALARLAERAHVVDLCCGKAELLIRFLEASRGRGLGVDISAHYLAEARVQAERRLPAGGLDLRCADAATFQLEPASFDLACWVGGAARVGSFADVARTLAAAVHPGGKVLIGELYWRREPEPDHIAAFFGTASVFGLLGHEGNAAAASSAGLSLLWEAESTHDEWDSYEADNLQSILRWAEANRQDPRQDQFVARARASDEEYWRWRRDALGFGFYLYRKE